MVNKKIKLVYIAGMGHSGSTILNLLLGSHSKIQAVGELGSRLNELIDFVDVHKFDANINKNSFWSGIRNELLVNISDSDFSTAYPEVIRILCKKTGKNIICDSSKGINTLKRILDLNLYEILIIHLTKDPRAALYSYITRAKRKKIQDFSPLETLKEYVEMNNKIEMLFSKNQKCKYMRIKYEDLSLETTKVLKKLAKFVGIEYEVAQLDYAKNKKYLFTGNRLIFKEEKRIQYDDNFIKNINFFRWLLYTMYSLPSILKYEYSLIKPSHKNLN